MTRVSARDTAGRATAILLASLIVAMLIPASAFAVTPDPANDIPAATNLAAMPLQFSDSLNVSSDIDDVFYIDLARGDVLDVTITQAAAGSNFDIALYAPGATTVVETNPGYVPYEAGSEADAYPEQLTYEVREPGRYYVDLWALEGSGAYTVTWSRYVDGPDFDIPGVALPASPVSATFTAPHDRHDVYRFTLAEDEMIDITMTGAGVDFDMYLWSEESTTVSELGITPFIMASATEETPNERISYLCPPGAAGTYYLDVVDYYYGAAGGGNYTLTYTKGVPAAARLAGLNRYQTSFAISRSDFADASAAVLATGENYPDALAASGLAGVLDAPVLLVPPVNTPDYADLVMELRRLGAADVYLVGGTGVISDAVQTDLQAGFNVKRLAGTDRYATALKVAEEMVVRGADPKTAFVVSGASFADALSVSPYAFSQGFPILLTQPESLSSAARTFIEGRAVTDVVIAGGTGAVSGGVEASINGLPGVDVARLGGINRYETAAKMATWAIDTKGWSSWEYTGIATGENFPDALAGGAACGVRNGALLLTLSNSLIDVTEATIAAHKAPMKMALIFGGTGAVSEPVKRNVVSAMQ